MEGELQHLREALQAKNLFDVRSTCKRMFGCEDLELDELTTALTEFGFFSLCEILDQIRRAPEHQRATLALGVPLTLARDELSHEKNERALAAAKSIIQRFPDRAHDSKT